MRSAASLSWARYSTTRKAVCLDALSWCSRQLLAMAGANNAFSSSAIILILILRSLLSKTFTRDSFWLVLLVKGRLVRSPSSTFSLPLGTACAT
ncbi:hypothetical protein TNIN_364571 [Trichonephila inaurata madagascariensis]|uniref:Uncharacterized protein n=1 Tax=Trichonephila inaurata madagascariensis TaxID=2747483 RepID=A0A8X6M6Y1_9ARAC|nr:hypothetical protein TNIN_364571 [Trichonephila inaurata madagascariensis]